MKMRSSDKRLRDLEQRLGVNGPDLRRVAVVREGDEPSEDSTFVIELQFVKPGDVGNG